MISKEKKNERCAFILSKIIKKKQVIHIKEVLTLML